MSSRGRRWAIFLIGLVASLALTAGLWLAGFGGFFLFLAFPLLFWPRRGFGQCPRCGATTRRRRDRYCPSDAEPFVWPDDL